MREHVRPLRDGRFLNGRVTNDAPPSRCRGERRSLLQSRRRSARRSPSSIWSTARRRRPQTASRRGMGTSEQLHIGRPAYRARSRPSISRSTSAVASPLSSGAKDASCPVSLGAASPPLVTHGEGCGAGQKGAKPALALMFYKPRPRAAASRRHVSRLLHSRKAPNQPAVPRACQAATEPNIHASSSLSDSESDKCDRGDRAKDDEEDAHSVIARRVAVDA